MAKFLTTKGVASEIENIIIKAKKEIVLVSPFLQINQTFYERLGEASEGNIPITIIYGKDDLKNRERRSLHKLKTLSLFYFENLHAKCYYNEDKLIVSSMNMFSFSEINNREMGILVKKDEDTDLYNDAVIEVKSILKHSEKEFGKYITELEQDSKQIELNDKYDSGFCIRCEKNIAYNLDKPYCIDCFYVWNEFENVNYEESVCHSCGEYNSSTMLKPECWNCYRKN